MLRCAHTVTLSLACCESAALYARHGSRAPPPRLRSQWGRVEDEATESMTPHKPAALSTQSGLLSPRQRGARTPLLLVVALCVMQLLLLAVLGGGLTGARWTLERLDAALEGVRRSPALLVSRPSTSCRQLHDAASEEQDASSCGGRSTVKPLGIKLLHHSVPGTFHAKVLRKLVCLNQCSNKVPQLEPPAECDVGGLATRRAAEQQRLVAGLDPAQLQALPPGLVDWDTLLSGHRLVSQEEEPDGLHSDAISFAASGTYSRRAPGLVQPPAVGARCHACSSGCWARRAWHIEQRHNSAPGSSPDQHVVQLSRQHCSCTGSTACQALGGKMTTHLRASSRLAPCRAYTVRAGGALTNTTVAAGTWATGSGVLSLLATSGNSSGVGAAPEQRTLARQGAFVRIGNAATGQGELYVCLVGS
jgi:hypothetical protein